MHQGRRRQHGMGLMLLFYQLFGVIGIENIPSVTLGYIALQVAIFLRLFKLPWYDASQVCVSVYKVWKKKEFLRLLYGALEHGDDWHLYYNMFSFALKGQTLERRFGSFKFLYVITSFILLTNAVLVTLSAFASEFLGFDEHECAIGFSGVIFALKVLTTYYNQNYAHQIMGIPIIVPARYAVWVELLLIQLLIPNVSFFGHFAGVLVGMAYVKGPLGVAMNALYSLFSCILFPNSQPLSTSHEERNRYSNESFSQFVPPGMSEEEQLQRAMEESMQDSYNFHSVPPYPESFTPRGFTPPPPGFAFEHNFHESPPPPGFAPDIEELRNRRNARFSTS